jgi:glycosyltransferase involved in cell wall biosynthesis
MTIVQALGWYYPDSLGGTEAYVAGLCQRLRTGGHTVWVAAPDPRHERERTYTHDGVPVYRYPIPAAPTRDEAQGTVAVRGTEYFHAWLARTRPDIVHLHTFVTGLGLAESKAAKAAGARVIVTTHSSSLGYICQRGTLMRWGTQLCDGVTAPGKCAACALQHRGLPKPLARAAAAVPAAFGRITSRVPGKLGTALAMRSLIRRNQALQQELLATVDKLVLLTQRALDTVARNGAPAGKLYLNRLGVSQAVIKRKPGPEMRPTAQPILVGYLGRFDPIKGVHDLARAVGSLPAHVALRVEFRGPAATQRERDVVHTLRALMCDDSRVTFADAVPPSQALDVLSGYDTLCCPSVCLEGGPTVALEAHAIGTPVIGSRIGGLAELITDGIDGRLVAPGDWRALVRQRPSQFPLPAATIDRWRRVLPAARTMDAVAADYLSLYAA